MNHKRLFRLYREEKLAVRRRGGRKRAIGTRAPMLAPMRPDERWSLDFVSDQLTDGRRFRILAIVDELADAYDGRMKVAKVNIDQNRATAIRYHVRSIPMLLLFKDGQIQATQIGAVGKGQLSQMVDKALA